MQVIWSVSFCKYLTVIIVLREDKTEMRVIQYMFAASLCNTPFDKNKKRFLSILVSCFVCSRILNIAWLKPMQTGWKHENIPYKQIFHYMFVLRSFPHLFTFTPSFFFFWKNSHLNAFLIYETVLIVQNTKLNWNMMLTLKFCQHACSVNLALSAIKNNIRMLKASAKYS